MFPEGYFPRTYENLRGSELLEEYLDHHPQGENVRLDRETHSLRVPEPWSWKKAWKDLRKRAGF